MRKKLSGDKIKPSRYLITTLSFFLIITFQSVAMSNDDHYISPSYVRVITNPYEQYNDINPNWSSDGKYISFERYDMFSHKIILANKSGKKIQTIVAQKKQKSEFDILFSTESEVTSYNTGISWADKNNEFVFISSGKTNNFDLFVGKVGTDKTRRLTFNPLTDNQAKWSPVSKEILFISARDKHAGLYRINARSGKITKILSDDFDALNPVWSPDGKKIALMIKKEGGYQIHVINDINNADTSLTLLSKKSKQNIRPSWSPDGKKVAYFSLNKNDTWNINVALANIQEEVTSELNVAANVIQNANEGPTWLPDSRNIAYIKNETNTYNPIYIVDTKLNKHSLLLTNTTMNYDLSSSKDGILAFQTQDRQWTRIYIAKIPGFNH